MEERAPAVPSALPELWAWIENLLIEMHNTESARCVHGKGLWMLVSAFWETNSKCPVAVSAALPTVTALPTHVQRSCWQHS